MSALSAILRTYFITRLGFLNPTFPSKARLSKLAARPPRTRRSCASKSSRAAPAFYKPILRRLKRNKSQAVIVAAASVAVVLALVIVVKLRHDFKAREAKQAAAAALKAKQDAEASMTMTTTSTF